MKLINKILKSVKSEKYSFKRTKITKEFLAIYHFSLVL